MRVPVYDGPQVRQAPAPEAYQRINATPEAFGAGAGQALQQGGRQLDRAADTLADFAAAQQKARQAADLANANAGATKALAELEFEFERDTDYRTAPQRYTAKAAEIRKQHMDTISDPTVRRMFDVDFTKLETAKSIVVRRMAFKRETDAEVARLDINMDSYAEALANAKTLQERDIIFGMARAEIAGKAQAGYITAEDAGKRERGFFSRVEEVHVRRAIMENPEQVARDLADPKKYRGLEEKDRQRLLELADRKADMNLRTRLAAEERSDRHARRALEDRERATSKDAWALHADGRLSREWIDQNRANLDAHDYKALLEASRGRGAKHDDPGMLADLYDRMDREDVRADAARAMRSGLIKPDTFETIVTKNRSLLADDQPASPYRSARERIKSSLDPGFMSGAAEQPMRVNQQNGLQEFDLWVRSNPNATSQEIRDEADAVVKRYQTVAWDKMTTTLGLPRTYAGARNALGTAELDAAERATVEAYKSGQITETIARAELRKIEQWREALRFRPEPTGGAKK
jgi:hypothetical protein